MSKGNKKKWSVPLRARAFSADGKIYDVRFDDVMLHCYHCGHNWTCAAPIICDNPEMATRRVTVTVTVMLTGADLCPKCGEDWREDDAEEATQ